ncbi:MAG TPA: hypothetical protein VH061_15120 [Solirubrobacteraceae bacterium]|jgi:hypothetical protein|nr:hypothetical protein [Solirubrobacteraceae bacterium]
MVAALACAAVLGALAGCGSSHAVSGTIDPVAQAAEATTHADGAQLAMRVSIELPTGGAPLTIAGHGDINLKDREAELFMTVQGLPPSVAQKLPSGGLTMTELLSKGAIYIDSPVFGSKLPNGANWLKLDLGKAASSLGLDPQTLTSGQTDPSQYLQFLKASGDIQKVGSDTVRGVATTRYKGTIDLSKVAALAPSKDKAATKAAIEKLTAQLGRSSLPMEVWIDSKHMVRKLQLSLSVSVSGQHVGTKIEEELFGFGPTPGVNPPAAGEVYELPVSSLTSSSTGVSAG